MMAGILNRAGAHVTHHSPMYASWDGRRQPKAWGYDEVVVVIRDGHSAIRSLVDNGHVPTVATDDKGEEYIEPRMLRRARVMQCQSLLTTLQNLETFDNVHIVTYESIIYRDYTILYLLSNLGLNVNIDISDIGDANLKYYGGEDFRDQRESYDR